MRPAPSKPSMQSYRVLSSSPIHHSRPSGGIDSDDEDNVSNASARPSIPLSRSHSSVQNPFSAPADVYGDERVNNELLEEICNEIGIRDVADIDQFVFQSNFAPSMQYYPPTSFTGQPPQSLQGAQSSAFRAPPARGHANVTARAPDGQLDASSASNADHSQHRSGQGLAGSGADGSTDFSDMELFHQLIFLGESGGPPLPESQSSPLNPTGAPLDGFQPLLQPSGAPQQTQYTQGLNPYSYNNASASSTWNANPSNTSGYFSWQQQSQSVSMSGAGAGAGAGAAYPSNPSPSEMPMYDYSNYELYYSRMMNKRLMSARAEPSAPASPKKQRVRTAADAAAGAGGERTSPGNDCSSSASASASTSAPRGANGAMADTNANGNATANANGNASAVFSVPDVPAPCAVQVKNEAKPFVPAAGEDGVLDASATAIGSDSDPSPAPARPMTATSAAFHARPLPANAATLGAAVGANAKSSSQNSSPLQTRKALTVVPPEGEASAYGPLKSSGSLGSRPSPKAAASTGQTGTRIGYAF